MWISAFLLLTLSVLSGSFAVNRCDFHALEEPVVHEHRVLLAGGGDAVVHLFLVDCVTAETRGTLCMGPHWQIHAPSGQPESIRVDPKAYLSLLVVFIAILCSVALCMQSTASRVYVVAVRGGFVVCTRGSRCSLHAARIYAARDHLGFGWWLGVVLHLRTLLGFCCFCCGWYQVPFPFYIITDGQADVLCTLGAHCPDHSASITTLLQSRRLPHL